MDLYSPWGHIESDMTEQLSFSNSKNSWRQARTVEINSTELSLTSFFGPLVKHSSFLILKQQANNLLAQVLTEKSLINPFFAWF